MKFLLVLVVVIAGLWLLLRKGRDKAPPATPRRPPADRLPAEMVACAHCDLRLPRAEALLDAEGRAYCDDVHRRAGPR